MDLEKLKKIIKDGRCEWRKHALQRLMEREIKQKEVIDVIIHGEQIEDYPEDKPYPSALIMGWRADKPLHVVVALDIMNQRAYIITVYEPSLDEFEPDFKTRRKKS